MNATSNVGKKPSRLRPPRCSARCRRLVITHRRRGCRRRRKWMGRTTTATHWCGSRATARADGATDPAPVRALSSSSSSSSTIQLRARPTSPHTDDPQHHPDLRTTSTSSTSSTTTSTTSPEDDSHDRAEHHNDGAEHDHHRARNHHDRTEHHHHRTRNHHDRTRNHHDRTRDDDHAPAARHDRHVEHHRAGEHDDRFASRAARPPPLPVRAARPPHPVPADPSRTRATGSRSRSCSGCAGSRPAHCSRSVAGGRSDTLAEFTCRRPDRHIGSATFAACASWSTNDDGIDAEGLHVLARRSAAAGHDVVVAAPDCRRQRERRRARRVPCRLAHRRAAGRRSPIATHRRGPWPDRPGLCTLAARLGAFGHAARHRRVGHQRRASTPAARSCTPERSARRSPRRTSAPRDSPSASRPSEPWRWDTAATIALEVLDLLVEAPARSVLNLNVPALAAMTSRTSGGRGSPRSASVRAAIGEIQSRRHAADRAPRRPTSNSRPTPTPRCARPATRRSPRSSGSPRRGRPS